MKIFKITEQDVVGLLNYLKQKPYQEVAGGITLLNSLEEVKKDEEINKK